MKNQVIKNILTPDGYKLLPDAMRELEALERRREIYGAPFLKKRMKFGGVWILLHSMIGFNKIIMWGGVDLWHILFSNGRQSLAYNYLTDKILSITDAFSGDLAPGFNQRSQFANEGKLTFNGNKFVPAGVESEGAYRGGVYDYEAAIYSSGSKINAMLEDGEIELSEVTHNTDLVHTDRYSVFIPVSPTDIEWNQLDTTIVYQRFLSNATPGTVFKWIPSFFYAEEMNGTHETGWHYGKPGAWSVGDDFTALVAEPLAGEAQLLTFMESRSPGLQNYKFGYCEALTSINMAPEISEQYMPALPVLSFFVFDGFTEDEGEIWFNWRSNVILAWADMRGGTKPTGMDRAFSFEDPFENGEPPTKVHMWAFEAWHNTGDPASLPDSVGVALIQNDKAIFYIYRVYLSEVFTTNAYHSHSLTPDGTILAVFESNDGINISKVTVFDLYGEKADPLTDYTVVDKTPLLYAGGGFTKIREREFDTNTEADRWSTACLIPHRIEDFEINTFIDQTPWEATYPQGLYYPAMGSLNWPRDGNGALTINKMVIVDGLFGSAGKSVDECFDSTIVIDDPASPPGTDRLVTSWAGGTEGESDLNDGLIRGSFTGTHPNMRFAGIGDGSIKEVTLPDDYLFVEQVDPPGWYAERAVGDLDVQGPLDPPIGDCEESTYDKYIATDSCGRVETIQDTLPAFVGNPTLSLPDGSLIGPGTEIEITGVAPFTATGNFSVSGNILTYTGTTDCAELGGVGSSASVSTTVTDKCGNMVTGEYRVDVLGGSWCCDAIGGGLWCETYGSAAAFECVSVNPSPAGCSFIPPANFGCFNEVGLFNYNNYRYQIGVTIYIDSGSCFNPANCTCPGGGPLNGGDPCSDGTFSEPFTQARITLNWKCS